MANVLALQELESSVIQIGPISSILSTNCCNGKPTN